jgi:hypothetical protein
MKQLTLCFCAFLFLNININAQGITATQKSRSNVLKTNLLSPLSIGYEHGFGKHFSMAAYGLYFPSFNFGTPTDALGYVSLEDPSSGFTVEARLYLSKTKAPLTGTYIGGYYLFRIADVISHKITNSATSKSNIKSYIPSDLTSYGLMIGKQKIREKGFTTDFNFGLGYYSVGNIPEFSSDGSTSSLLAKLSKLRSGIGPRMNFCLGYAF